MEIIGIICEYNPFHNGHEYHIKKVRGLYPDSLIVLVMSTYFTERGDISLLNKYDKVMLALKYGVDLVLELPCLYTLNSADFFADAAVKILNYGGVKKIVFGSETNDVEKLKRAASMQIDNQGFDVSVREELSKGLNYPTALARVTGNDFKSNDLLGIAYIKAILKNSFDIEPVTIKRTNDFKDLESTEEIISAENIRTKYNNGEDIRKYIPNYSTDLLKRVNYGKLFTLLKFKIVTENDLAKYLGVDEGLDSKLKNVIIDSNSFDELIKNLKSKRYTYVRIKRMLIHILLGIKKEDMKTNISYARVIGFNKSGRSYLKNLDKDFISFKNEGRIREIEMQSSYIYDELTMDKTMEREIKNKPLDIEK